MMRILVAVGLAVGVLVPANTPAAAAAPGADCGTPNDTPPAIFIPNNTSCDGTHDGETYSVWSVSDAYGFAATVDDVITIGFTRQCHSTFLSAEGSSGTSAGTITYKAPKKGPPGNEEDPQFYSVGVTTWAGFDGGGCTGTTNYNVAVYVIPNTRPGAAFVTAPTTAFPGEPQTVTLAGYDPDGNLRNAYLRATHPGFATQNFNAPFDSSGRATFSVALPANATLTAWADDGFTAVSEQVTRSVTLEHDDCGSGADATTYPISFGTECRGHLAGSMGDDTDSYTFDVPAGVDRVAVDVTKSAGNLVTSTVITPPAGDPVSGTGPFFLDAVEGTWSVQVSRTGTSYGAYDLSVRPIGPPAAPVPTASTSPPNQHQWEPVTLTFGATDPNGERVRFLVDWGDASAIESFPATGTVPSGSGGSLSHAFAASATPRTVTVTAFNQEGLSGATTSVVNVRGPDDVCAGSSGTATDAPSQTNNWTAAQNARFRMRAPDHCDGELGFVLSKTPTATNTDIVDAYKFSVCSAEAVCDGAGSGIGAGRPVRIRLATAGGLSARMRVGIGGTRILTAMATPGAPAVISLVALPHIIHEVVIDQPSGKGSYDLDVTLDQVVPGL